MNKFFTSCLFILSIFFLFSSNVSASSYTYTISDDKFSFLEDNLSTMKNTVESFISSSDDLSNDYIIVYLWSNYYVFIKPLSSIASSVTFSASPNSGPFYITANAYYGTFSSDFKSITSFNRSIMGALKKFYSDSSIFYYSSYDIYFDSDINNTYNFTHGADSYSIINSKSNSLPSIYDLYIRFNGPIIPEDNYPILTSFFSVFLDRLSFLADYIVNSYIFLSIFVVFLFTFAFLLLRRLSQ